MTASDLETLAARFADASLPAAEWTHLAHLRVGAWHVHHFGAERALPLLRERIRKLNEHHGTGNSPARGYHETITAAYVRLIAELLAALPAETPLAERVAHLVAGPLAERSLLAAFWSRELLMSPEARQRWVDPDLAPLGLPAAALPR